MSLLVADGLSPMLQFKFGFRFLRGAFAGKTAVWIRVPKTESTLLGYRLIQRLIQRCHICYYFLDFLIILSSENVLK